MHFSRVFSVIVAQNSEQNGLAFYVGIPKLTILAPPLSAPSKIKDSCPKNKELKECCNYTLKTTL
jgi:hypothetical protein